MSNLISAVADMTGQRDRDLLEVTVAEVLFSLLDARRLSLWKVIEHPQGARVRLMAGLSRGQAVAMSDPAVEHEMLPRLDEFDGFCACFATHAPMRMATPDTGGERHVFPVGTAREAVGILEVDVDGEMTTTQEQLIDGLLRIYRNHLTLLDYSENDTLTGLLNRRTFEDVFARRISRQSLADEMSRHIEYVGQRRIPSAGETPWLAVIDIDFFKRVNDRFGHLFGDEVLLLVARIMRSVFRPHDVLFRFGGEEFVVLLSATNAAGARVAVERLRATVEAYAFPQVGQVTISIGFTCVSPDDSPIGAFERGDDALYLAKQLGRNRALCWEELIESGELTPKVAPASEIELF